MNPLFVSCHTPDDLYQEAAGRLRTSLMKHGLEHEIHSYQALGTWRENTCYKPFFIRSMLEKHPGRSLVWLDADAEVIEYPELLFQMNGVNLAAGYLCDEFLSGTMYFGNTEATMGLLKLWLVNLQEQERRPRAFKEQISLGKAKDYLVSQGLLTFQPLPFEYVRIFDVTHPAEAVILHHQLSRKGRKLYG